MGFFFSHHYVPYALVSLSVASHRQLQPAELQVLVRDAHGGAFQESGVRNGLPSETPFAVMPNGAVMTLYHLPQISNIIHILLHKK